MIFWQGMGFLVPVTLFLAYPIQNFIIISANRALSLYWTAAILCLVVDFFVKKYRSSTCEEIVLTNDSTGKEKKHLVKYFTNMKTGEQYAKYVKDTFFWIPIKNFGIIFFLLGIASYIASS